MRVFPNAKVVLSIRDPEKWYESVKSSIYTIRKRLSGPPGLLAKLVGAYPVAMLMEKIQNHPNPVTSIGN